MIGVARTLTDVTESRQRHGTVRRRLVCVRCCLFWQKVTVGICDNHDLFFFFSSLLLLVVVMIAA